MKNKFLKAAIGIILYGYANDLFNNNKYKSINCCGILGFLNNNSYSLSYMLQGIHLLQNRGYDSCGISSIIEGTDDIITSKFSSDYSKNIDCINLLHNNITNKHNKSKISIAHTRWATCGKVCDENSHPHLDWKNRISLIHNGTIFNYKILKEKLLELNKNITFKSETDSEVIANYIGYYLDIGESIFEAINHTLSKLDGTWGLIIMYKNEKNKLFVARNGSPIIIGISNDGFYITSEQIALYKYTNQFINLKNNELKILDLNNINLNDDSITIIKHQQSIKLLKDNNYYFIQEIREQPDCILNCLRNYSRILHKDGYYSCKLGGFESNFYKLITHKHLIFLGCGTSYNATLFISNLLKKLKISNNIKTIEASNFEKEDIPVGKKYTLFCYSQSGETADIYKIVKELKNDKNSLIVGIINVVGSLLTQYTQCGIYLECGKEFAVAATKSFTNQIVTSLLLAIWYSYAFYKEEQNEIRKEIYNALYKLPKYSKVIIEYFTNNICTDCNIANCNNVHYKLLSEEEKQIYNLISESNKLELIADKLINYQTLYILSKGIGFPFAKEAALKIKELSYIHCEAILSGELKHGPLSLIDSSINESIYFILLIKDDEFLDDHIITIGELSARKAGIIIITDCIEKISNSDLANYIINIPSLGYLTHLLMIYPLQIFAYLLTIKKGFNPDKPRNLAKTITVY